MEIDIDTQTQAVQIIDGNGYLLRMLHRGESLRHLTQIVKRCVKPPIFTFDGKGGNDRRRARFPAYKSNRPEMGEDLFASINLFRELLGYMPSVVVQVDGWEADDVIATLVISYVKSGQKTRVVTPDRDLYQLAALPNCETTCSYENIEPRHVRAYKATVGDPSDAIPGIKNFGDKGWASLNHNALLRMLGARSLADEFLNEVGFKQGHISWLRGNADQFWAMFDVVGLLEVPFDEIKASMKIGRHEPSKLEERLREFLL